MMDWQPISTAPKDGTDIWLYSNVGERSSVGPTIGAWTVVKDTASEYHSTTGEYLGQSLQEAWEGWSSYDGGFTEEHPPTHWQPVIVPAPPK
jgi:hypothetical protein